MNNIVPIIDIIIRNGIARNCIKSILNCILQIRILLLKNLTLRFLKCCQNPGTLSGSFRSTG